MRRGLQRLLISAGALVLAVLALVAFTLVLEPEVLGHFLQRLAQPSFG